MEKKFASLIKTQTMKNLKETKYKKLKAYLKKKKNIDTWRAIELFGETRLSARIFDLKNKENWEFSYTDVNKKDRYGNTVYYRLYKLVSFPK
jgi:hypothetical protein